MPPVGSGIQDSNLIWYHSLLGTKQCYVASLHRAEERFSDYPIKDITTREINAHLMQMASQGFSKSTIKSQRVVYSLIFTRAIADGVMSENPASFAQIPTSAKKPEKRTAPEDDVVRRIKSGADTAYFGLFPFFLLCTGFRRGEALAIKWRDINNTGMISCSCQIQCRRGVPEEVPTKSESGIREVPLLPILAQKLKKPPEAKPGDYVFFGSDPSKPMPESTYNRRWKHYCKDMQFTDLTAHQLRHGYATMLFEAGVEEQTAMVYMGHSNIRITMEVYTHLRQAQKAKSAQKLLAYSEQMFGDE